MPASTIQVLALRGKVAVLRDEAFPTTLRRSKSRPPTARHKVAQAAARGSDDNPMSDKDLEDKLRTRPRQAIPGHDIAPLIEAIWQLDMREDISGLAPLSVPRA